MNPLGRVAFWGLVLVSLVAALVAGRNSLQVAHLRADAAELRATTAEATVQALQAAKARGDVLALRLATAETNLVTLTREKTDALRLATTGRTCLRGAALRVLDGAPGIRLAVVPPAAFDSAAAHAAAASAAGDADQLGAATAAGAGTAGETDATADLTTTDTQAGAWMLAAGAQFETCRARLHALIDYLAPSTP
jgi:hypothetical protein